MRPISKEQKEIQGTYEASRDAQPESIGYEEVLKFYAPEGWPDSAKVIFLDICKILRPTGYLRNAMYIGIRSMAFSEYLRREAESKLIDDPTNSKWCRVLDVSGKAVERWGSKFGFTPVDVQKIPAVKKDDTPMSLLK